MDNTLREKQLDDIISHYNPFCQRKSGLTEKDIDFFNTYWDNDATFDHAPVRIGSNCWICYRVSIMNGVTIGENTIIATKSVVMTSLPPNCVAAGNPAKVIQVLQNPIENAAQPFKFMSQCKPGCNGHNATLHSIGEKAIFA